jgi:hypothetical protein
MSQVVFDWLDEVLEDTESSADRSATPPAQTERDETGAV